MHRKIFQCYCKVHTPLETDLKPGRLIKEAEIYA